MGGARYAVKKGHGCDRDPERCEEDGTLEGADPAHVSLRAEQRGLGQVGSLGSGNHFLEVQEVETVYDDTRNRAGSTGSRRFAGVGMARHSADPGLGRRAVEEDALGRGDRHVGVGQTERCFASCHHDTLSTAPRTPFWWPN